MTLGEIQHSKITPPKHLPVKSQECLPGEARHCPNRVWAGMKKSPLTWREPGQQWPGTTRILR